MDLLRTFILSLGICMASGTGFCAENTEKFWIHWSTRNTALTSNCVYQVVPDDRGYVWLTTSNGISIFDGVKIDKPIYGWDPLRHRHMVANWDVVHCFNENGKRIWLMSSERSVAFIDIRSREIHTSVNTPFLRFFSPASNNTVVFSDGRSPGRSHPVFRISGTGSNVPRNIRLPGISDSVKCCHRYAGDLFFITKGQPNRLCYVRGYFSKNAGKAVVETWLEKPFLSDVESDAIGNLWVSTTNEGVYVLPCIFFNAVFSPCDQKKGAPLYLGRWQEDLLVGYPDGHFELQSMTDGLCYSRPIRQPHAALPGGLEQKNEERAAALQNSTRFLSVDDCPAFRTLLRSGNDLGAWYAGNTPPDIRQYSLPATAPGAGGFRYNINSTFCRTGDSVFLVCTGKGVMAVTPSGAKSWGDSLIAGNRANTIFFFSGRVLVFTNSGLFIADGGGKVQKHLSTVNGLLTDNCHRAKQFGPYMMLVQPVGFQIFDTSFSKPLFTHYAKSSLLSYDISDVEIVGETLVLAGETGLISIPLRDVLFDTTPFRIVISDWARLFHSNPDNLEYRSAGDTISFVASGNGRLDIWHNCFKSPGKILFIQYACWKAGQKPDHLQWYHTNYSLGLEGLSPGYYVLEYQAKDLSGHVQSDRKIIHVHPRWFQTGMFRTGFALVLLVAASSAVFFVFRSIRQRRARVDETNRRLLHLQSASLRNQMNPHFLFNSLNPLQYYLLNDRSTEALNYLDSFANLLRLMLQNMQRETHKLSEELVFLREYLAVQKDRYSNIFTYTFSLEGPPGTEQVTIPILIIQPVVENAIAHGVTQVSHPGKITIHIVESGEFLKVTIEDNGPGPDKGSLFRKGHGLSIIKERLEIIKTPSGAYGSIVCRRSNENTVFTLLIPKAE